MLDQHTTKLNASVLLGKTLLQSHANEVCEVLMHVWCPFDQSKLRNNFKLMKNSEYFSSWTEAPNNTEQHWVKKSHAITVQTKTDHYCDENVNNCSLLRWHIALKVKFKDSTSSWVTMVWHTLGLGKSRFSYSERWAVETLIIQATKLVAMAPIQINL